MDQRRLQQGLRAQLTRRSTLHGAGAVSLAGVLAARGASGILAQEATPAELSYPEVVITATDYAFEMPATIDGGWTLLTIDNQGEDTHHAFIVDPTGEATVADIEAALESPDLGGLFESAVSIGGPPSIDAGQRASVAMNLAPGEYVAVCAIPGEDGMPHYMMGMYSTFEVTARAGNALPVFSDTKITLVDHAFEGLPAEVAAGQNTWEVFNDGEQLHEFLVGRLSPGVTFDQVTQMLSEAPEASPAAAIEASPVPSPVASPSAGGPPFTLLAGAAPMSPGQTVWSVMDFEAGDYFAICFVPDPESGAPHFALGMIAPFTVT